MSNLVRQEARYTGYSAALGRFHADLVKRFTAQGFALVAQLDTGHVQATKGRFVFEFADGAQAERFIHGYEFALDDMTDWLGKQG